MPDAPVDRPEGRQQPAPGIVPALQHLLAEAGRRVPQLLPQGRDGVVLVVELVAQQQQFPLLGAEQEHQPHHDRQGGFVELGLGHARQQLPAAVLVRPVDRLDQHLDRLADLIAKLVGDFLLVLGALGEQPFERLVLGHAEEPVLPSRVRNARSVIGSSSQSVAIPRGVPGRLALRGIDQHPVVAVGDEPEPDARVVQAVASSGCPVTPSTASPRRPG